MSTEALPTPAHSQTDRRAILAGMRGDTLNRIEKRFSICFQTRTSTRSA